MMDLKVLNSALGQLEEERGIPREKIIDAIEQALAAAYKKDYGKKGQIVRARFDLDTGATEFSQVKIVVDPEMLMHDEEEVGGETKEVPSESEPRRAEHRDENEEAAGEKGEKLIRFNTDHHILLEDARRIKKDAEPGDELEFPLETKADYGRIAAQTAKQVIIQRIREAEKVSVMEEYDEKQGSIVTGTVQRVERGNIFVDMGKTTGILPYDEQIPGERYRQGERIRAYLYSVEETPRGISLRLSRSHPKLIAKLFETESPEIASGVVEIKAIAREAGSRTKIAVFSHDEHIDPVGACVGQRGVRVSTVMSELGGEKIDIIEWSEEPKGFVEDALSPARVEHVEIDEKNRRAIIDVAEDQLSLAIGKGGQNVRLAAKLTGWKIDIRGTKNEGAGELTDKESEIISESENDKTSGDAEDAAREQKVSDKDKEATERGELTHEEDDHGDAAAEKAEAAVAEEETRREVEK